MKTKKKDIVVGFNGGPPPKIKFKFDKSILNMFIGYAFCDDKSVTKKDLSNLYKLLELTDDHTFEADVDIYTRFDLAKTALEGRLYKEINKPDLLKSYCKKLNNELADEVLSHIDEYTKISNSELKFIQNAVIDRLQYSFIMIYKELLMNAFMRIDMGDYDTYKEVVDEVKEIAGNMMNEIRKANSATSNLTFSLNDEIFDDLVEVVVQEVIDPTTVLVTGLQVLNQMLSPGYIKGRLYLYMGITGGWKSVMLLSTCYWIKKYNNIQPENPGKRLTVLYISNENSIAESVIRFFNMSVTDEDISKFDPKEVVRLMKEKGGFVLKDENDIDIVMQYYGNMEISTGDLYGIIEDLEDDNREVICLVLDYIKRIRCVQKATDERTQLANASNELKDLAVRKRIPVITAQQINRAGNMTIDAAMESGKEDLARFLGRGNIAQSWDMLENCDWAAILNIEVERSSAVRYLTIKEIKKRYKSLTQIDYMNQPFKEGSTIQLVEDFYLDKPAAKLSLASDLVGIKLDDINSSRGSKTAKKRREIDESFNKDFDFENGL